MSKRSGRHRQHLQKVTLLEATRTCRGSHQRTQCTGRQLLDCMCWGLVACCGKSCMSDGSCNSAPLPRVTCNKISRMTCNTVSRTMQSDCATPTPGPGSGARRTWCQAGKNYFRLSLLTVTVPGVSSNDMTMAMHRTMCLSTGSNFVLDVYLKLIIE